ncbi:MAG: hypothetical protein ACLFM7_10025 [Bacteroidales bacterium]
MKCFRYIVIILAISTLTGITTGEAQVSRGKVLEGKERLTDHFLENNPFHIVKNTDKEKLNSVRYYIDCGDDDFLSPANNEFHNLLMEEDIQHEYRVRDGHHSWEYWRTGLIDGLRFIGKSFHQF